MRVFHKDMKGDGVQANERNKKILTECVRDRWSEGLGIDLGNGGIRK